jgi:hypothetical protein
MENFASDQDFNKLSGADSYGYYGAVRSIRGKIIEAGKDAVNDTVKETVGGRPRLDSSESQILGGITCGSTPPISSGSSSSGSSSSSHSGSQKTEETWKSAASQRAMSVVGDIFDEFYLNTLNDEQRRDLAVTILERSVAGQEGEKLFQRRDLAVTILERSVAGQEGEKFQKIFIVYMSHSV